MGERWEKGSREEIKVDNERERTKNKESIVGEKREEENVLEKTRLEKYIFGKIKQTTPYFSNICIFPWL